MSFIALWVGVLIFGLGAIFSLLSAVRTLQISRRWSDYRLRRRYVVQARGSVLLAVLSGALAVALLVFGRLLQPAVPASPPPTLPPTETMTASVEPPRVPTETAVIETHTPTVMPVTPSPSPSPTNSITPTTEILPTSTITATPVMPIAVQAMVQGTATPAFDVQFGRLRFSTEINNYTLVAPGEEFQNPIKQMYSVFTYQPVGVKVEWTALWYQNGELKYVDTTSWQDFPPGVAVASWLRPAPEWKPGDYEVQIFVGTDWMASGRFVLEGEPPTVTPSPAATETPAITVTSSPLPPPSRTPRPTQTVTAVPSATRTQAPSPTPTSSPTRTVTASPAATRTPAPTATGTTPPSPTSTFTPIPTATATRTATLTPTRTPSPTATATLPPVDVRIYFTNTRATGSKTPPFNEAVRRVVPGSANTVQGVLDVYFAGPTLEEQSRGLTAVRNGFVGYRKVEFVNGVLSVFLAGNCQPLGNGYSIAQPLIATLKQFPGVLHVKLFDAYDHTADTITTGDSWPACVDVIFTSTWTASPTATATSTPSHTPTATLTATASPTPLPTSTFTPVPTRTPTPIPTATSTLTPSATPLPTRTPTPLPTSTPLPTRTPIPSATPSLTPSATPRPTNTPTTTPSRTPSRTPSPTVTRTPTATSTPRPTLTPSKTNTPAPTNTPRPTLTLTPINAPTRTSLPLAQASATAAAPGSPTATLDAACNRVEFLGDVTIADNAIVRPGESFRKTWRIQNAGDCPWTPAYKLVFVRGERMSAPESVALPGLVAPGQSADISIDLIAPTSPGQYEGFWQLQTPNRVTFGIGPTATGNLWVKVHVAGEPVATVTATRVAITPSSGWAEATLTAFVATSTAEASLAAPSATPHINPTAMVVADLASSACDAQWQANEGILGCPGADSDARGAILPVSQATLEGGIEVTQPALLTLPSSAQDGYILGLYPQYQVQNGDRLQAVVGCEQGATACSVLFRVSYLDASGAAHDLWTLGEFHDGHGFDLDLDLSELVGQQVRFVLSVNDLGSTVDDRPLWIAPRIVRESVPADATRPAASATLPATLTAAPSPTPTLTLSPTATTTPSVPTPGTVPTFFESIINFFRQLFGTP